LPGSDGIILGGTPEKGVWTLDVNEEEKNVNAKTGIPPRQEQVDALLGDELAVSKKSQDLVPEDELGLVGIDIRDGMPGAVIEEEPARDDGVNVRIPLQRRPENLDDGDHAESSLGFAGRRSHHLADGFVSEPCELSQELPMK
jgi:hypothetical protein